MPEHGFTHHYLRFAGASVGCAVAAGALGFIPTARIGGDSAITAMMAALAVSVGASLLGAIPLAHTLATSLQHVATAALLGTTLRFLVVLAFVALLAFGKIVEPKPLVVWVVIAYLPILAVDTLVAVASVKRAQENAQ